jgi:hypothetical protein
MESEACVSCALRCAGSLVIRGPIIDFGLDPSMARRLQARAPRRPGVLAVEFATKSWVIRPTPADGWSAWSMSDILKWASEPTAQQEEQRVE